MISLSPKTRFQKTQDSAVHAELVVKDSFLNAITFALAEYEVDLPSAESPARSWDAYCKIMGAKEFINTLLNLAEPPTERRDIPNKNLQYDIKPPEIRKKKDNLNP